MGSSKKESSSSSQQQSTQVQATPEERELNKLQLEREKFLDPQIRDVQSQGLDLSSLLLRGQNLPGYLNTLPGGISPEVTQSIVDQSIQDIQPGFQQSGLLDSGVNAEISARTAADIRNQSEQFNLGNLQQLLNLAVGGQAQVQAPIQGFSSQLSSRLAGLRSTTSQGTGTVQRTTYNPFLTGENIMKGVGAAAGAAAGFCWVAAEVFGSWEDKRTHSARKFIFEKMPAWFIGVYSEYGERFASWLKKHRVCRFIVKKVFSLFAKLGGE